MSEDGSIITDLNLDGPQPNGADTGPAAGIISQYIKDLSVENPNAPASYQWQDPPQIDVQFNIGARDIDGSNGEVSEVELKISINSKCQSGTQFIVDLAYGGLIGMRNLDEGSRHAFTYAEAPRLLFPFARRVISDAVRDAGFPPLLLEPIDFNGIYIAQVQAQQGAEGEGVMGEA
ncbi:protein-export chaperone SecB [Novosphingobium sp.]|uniref:protein-export chaperone SecB n=1 Tax=Novosphingobium sp. TaxID=1874826 RepID=UPI0025DAC79F|nr:protein-export chaperone SecB [Novosphingobium sp.]MCC6924438.1 protein-export chaperone SecB [Novosphingobium sp.]